MNRNTMDNGELLVLKNLNVWYTKGKPVLEKFSMELGRNEVVGLVGWNGAGKTTFIKTLSGRAVKGQGAFFCICCVI